MSPVTTAVTKDPLLANALEAIENGMEDFADGRPSRVSSALRNLCAGVLLLLKEKLRQVSPPGTNGALIYKKLVPSQVNGAVVMVGKGKSTIDLEDIQDRLKPFGFDVDWKRVYTLRNLRNAVEHHQPAEPHAVMQQAIANTFIVLLKIFDQLGLSPPNELSEKAWKLMLEETETYTALEKKCKESQKTVFDVPPFASATFEEWLSCPACRSELLRVAGSSYADASFTCVACGATSDISSVMETALENEYAGAAYTAAKEGCENPIATCPTCNAEAFVVGDDICYVCGEGRPYKRCPRCGNGILVDEQDFNGLCGYCHHVMSKDD